MQYGFIGSIPEVIANPHKTYEGDLTYYARIIFNAENIHNGYHGLRHMLHVTWFAYKACKFYTDKELSRRSKRNLLIAALFHDYLHPGKRNDDHQNIIKAIAGLRKIILQEDRPYLSEIEAIIWATEYTTDGHKNLDGGGALEQQILRDADISQAFSPAWIGSIVAGLSSELGLTPLEMLNQQKAFLEKVTFYTEFGQHYFGENAIKAKQQETDSLIELLTTS